MKQPEKLVLIDGNALVHRAFHALPPLTSPNGAVTNAVFGFSSILLKLIKDLKPDYIAAAFDRAEPTFRHKQFEQYKMHRVKAPQELYDQIPLVKQVLFNFGIPIFEKIGYEADDLIGTIATRVKEDYAANGIQVVIATGDLDTLQLVDDDKVVVFTMRKGMSDTILYNKEAVERRFGLAPSQLPDYRGLKGDPSDNIPGVPGVGDKTATKLIQEFGSLEALYASSNLPEKLKPHKEQAFFSKQLSQIVRDLDIHFSISQARWRDHIDRQKLEKLFAEFGFRSLGKRLQALDLSPQESLLGESSHEISKETAIAASLLNVDVNAYNKKELDMKLKEAGLTKLYQEVELPLIAILADMQKWGIRVDTSVLKNLSDSTQTELDKLEKEIYKHAGVEFNINSPGQLGEVLFKKMGISGKVRKTVGGALSTAAPELEKLRDGNPIIDLVLHYRELQKLKSTYIEPLPSFVGADGRVHTTYDQTGTATGRLSSSNPNLQNIPVRTELGQEFRKAFVAEHGYRLVSCDYSQIELRIVAHIANDVKMIETFHRGEDIHTRTASEVFDVAPYNVTPEMRRQAKVLNFGVLYGMGSIGVARAAGMDRRRAQEFIDKYFTEFSGIAAYMELTKKQARERGYVKTLFGRRRNLPELSSTMPQVAAAGERMAVNMPIQGTAADLIKMAMIKVHDYLKDKPDVRMLLQVHDELVFEIKSELVSSVIPKLREIMENVHKFNVPIVVDVKAGENWQDMERAP